MADPSGIILQNRAEIRPIDFSEMGANLRQMKAQQYREAEVRRAEQVDLENRLANANAKGLPKYMSGEISTKTQQLIDKAAKGEIDPRSMEFRIGVAEIGGLANAYEQQTKQMMDFLAKPDVQVIEFDEQGNPYDKRQEIQEKFFGLYDTEYDGQNSAMDVYVKDFNQSLGRATKDLGYDAAQIERGQNNFLKSNSIQNTSYAPSEGIEGYYDKTIKTSVPIEAQAKWIDSFITENKASIISQYAKSHRTPESRQAEPLSKYAETVAYSMLPTGTTEVEQIDNKAYDAAQRIAAAKAGKEKPADFVLNEQRTTWNAALENIIPPPRFPEETQEAYDARRSANKNYIQTELKKLGTNNIIRTDIIPQGGKETPKRVVAGIEGIPTAMFKSADGKFGMVLMNVPKEGKYVYTEQKGPNTKAQLKIEAKPETVWEQRMVKIDNPNSFLQTYGVEATAAPAENKYGL